MSKEQSQEILKLIEAVDPSNEDALNEIDARADCFLATVGSTYEYKKFLRLINRRGRFGDGYEYEYKLHDDTDRIPKSILNGETGRRDQNICIKYTRSRDALKSIRPDGWSVTISANSDVYGGSVCELGAGQEFKLVLPTEELAELHAIIQAIQYERDNKQCVGSSYKCAN